MEKIETWVASQDVYDSCVVGYAGINNIYKPISSYYRSNATAV